MKPSDYIQGKPTVSELKALLDVFIAEETDPPFVARAIVLELGEYYLQFLPDSFDPNQNSPETIR